MSRVSFAGLLRYRFGGSPWSTLQLRAYSAQGSGPDHTGDMNPMKIICLLVGHKWNRERRSDRTVLLTCRRCGTVDAVDEDMGGGRMGGL